MTVVDPATFLRSLVSCLLPDGESFRIVETNVSERHVVLTIDAASNRGRAILMGSGGQTITAIRRICDVVSFKWNRRINIELTKGNIEHVERSEATVR